MTWQALDELLGQRPVENLFWFLAGAAAAIWFFGRWR